MLRFLRRLGGNDRGNALLIMAGAMPLVLGSAGLANDTIQWTLWKRQLQRAADSAAIAAAYARYEGTTPSTAVASDLSRNNHLWVPLLSGYPQTTPLANSGTYTKRVQVVLAASQSLPFSSMFMDAAPTITATSVAAAVPDGSYCVVALENGSTAGVTVGGSATANLGCGVISNSVNINEAVDTTGNAYTLAANPVAAVGGLPATIRGSTNLQPYHLAMADPFATLYPTDIPSGTTCYNNFNAGSYVSGGVTHARAGCYNSFNPGNGTTVMDAGVFYLNSTGLSTNGTTRITGTGVTLIFTGSSPGSLSMNGNSSINLSAPTTGTYAKMLMIQSSAATAANNNLINGNSSSGFDGAIYFPKGTISFSGSSSPATKCAMIVAQRVDFGGNTDIQNNTTSCVANQTVSAVKIRLTA